MTEQPNPADFSVNDKPGEYEVRIRIEGEIRRTIKADSLEELVILKTIANSLQRRVSANYHFVLTFNSALIALGAMGILQPASSAMLHNLSTIGISLKSMTNLIPEEKAQKALAEKN